MKIRPVLKVVTGWLLVVVMVLLYPIAPVWAFCGFYVAKADAQLYNQASQVAIARKDQNTIITMANDYQGAMQDFALVVPVPTVIDKEQVNVGENKILERLDSFSAPRLVEYFDADPCQPVYKRRMMNAAPAESSDAVTRQQRDRSLGVTVEKQFTVGEYDISILSAKESNGLQIWLQREGYRVPRSANSVLQAYIRQDMKFFVAKVNLSEFDKTGYTFLRPLQIAYRSPKYMLPIRLGMVNAKGEQDLILYVLSPKGRTEVNNYRTVKIPSNLPVPEFVKSDFANVYKSAFQRSYERENKKVAFMEYAWDMSSCDPCSAEPLSAEELKKAGVFWLEHSDTQRVFITRLHVRYGRDKFPEDLFFSETSNQESFQGRYVITHPYGAVTDTKEVRRPLPPNTNCSNLTQQYQRQVVQRREREAQTLASLTGWNINDIRRRVQGYRSS